MLARERLIEIGASVGGVGIMVALLYFIGTTHATEQPDGHMELSQTGGKLVVFGIVGFVVLMAIVGVLLTYTVTVPEARDGNGDPSDA